MLSSPPQPVARALATDTSPVTVLPLPSDPAIAPDLLRAHAARVAAEKSACSTSKSIFVLGTRNSKLAMAQTHIVKRGIEARWPDLDVRIFGMVRISPTCAFCYSASWTSMTAAIVVLF
jgi:hypothetical protein